MQITINHNPTEIKTKEGETLGDFVSRIENHLHQKEMAAITLEIDGKTISLDQKQTLDAESASNFSHINIEALHYQDLAFQTIQEVKPLLKEVENVARETAIAFQEGRGDEVKTNLDSILQVWAVLFETLTNASKYHHFQLNEIVVGDSDLDKMSQKLSEHLKELESALTHHDFVTIADLLEYEMAEQIPLWENCLEIVIDYLKRLRSDGSPRK